MTFLKKILSLCLGVMLCMCFFNACESTETQDKRHAKECYESIVKCINDKNISGFKALFNSVGSAALKEADIELMFSTFSSGITTDETMGDDSLVVTDWVEGDSYGKTVNWGHVIINNETGERFIISGLQCTDDWTNEDLGIIWLVLCSVDDEEDFDNWWTELEEDERPNGMILYGFDD